MSLLYCGTRHTSKKATFYPSLGIFLKEAALLCPFRGPVFPSYPALHLLFEIRKPTLYPTSPAP